MKESQSYMGMSNLYGNVKFIKEYQTNEGMSIL